MWPKSISALPSKYPLTPLPRGQFFQGNYFFCFLGVLEEPGTCVALLHASSWALCNIFNDFFTVSCVKKHFLLNQELAWRSMYHAQGWKPALNLLLLHRVPPLCCTSALCFLIVVLFISWFSQTCYSASILLERKKWPLHFVIVLFLLTCIFLCLSWILYQITVEVASQTISNSDQIIRLRVFWISNILLISSEYRLNYASVWNQRRKSGALSSSKIHLSSNHRKLLLQCQNKRRAAVKQLTLHSLCFIEPQNISIMLVLRRALCPNTSS